MMLNHNNMPGAGSISDTMEFMRKMWEGLGAPAMGVPSLSVEDLDKKIADLKTVASWLELNMNMLRATIQAMEVQSATLSNLQAMGAMLKPRDHGDATAKADAGAASPFSFSGWPSHFAPQPTPQAQAAEEQPSGPGPVGEREAKSGTAAEEAPATGTETDNETFSFPQVDFQAPMNNPNAWWNLLQNQFRQAIGNVLEDQAPAEKKAPAAKKKATKAAVKAKPRTRTKSTVVQSRQSKPASRKPKSP